MGDGSGDFQISWHTYFGKYFSSASILDVGAGIGKSKQRLQYNLNNVTTQDINPDRKGLVDILQPIEEITTKFDYVVSFDVIEHVDDQYKFLIEKKRLSTIGVLDTTPNWYLYPRDWHFTSSQFYELYLGMFGDSYRYSYFFRIKTSDRDYVEETTQQSFLDDKTKYAYGILAVVNE
jgi:hypothetical protein